MRPRTEFHAVLVDLLGSTNVYFQPPPSLALIYPCIVYKRDNTYRSNGDNNAYLTTRRYSVTVISKDPDFSVPDTLINTLPMCSHESSFTADNLYHHVFSVYF